MTNKIKCDIIQKKGYDMMKDIEIKISRETRMVDLSKTTIGNDGENLQGNLVFSFTDDFVKGQGRLEYVINGESKYAFLLSGDENYYIPIKSVMTKEGQIDMQLVITEGTDVNEIPIFKSNVFYVSCKKSINAEVEEEEGYYSWIEIANTKLNEVDQAIEELASQSDYAKEQGDYAKSEGDNAKSVAEETERKAQEGAFDGKSLEFVWQGTKLGVRLEGQEEYQFVDLKGVQGEIGATGEPFKIKKTYASVSEMNADFANMQFGDYVMIASSVEVEDNAKLYTRGESAWIFISDFSGAMGIRGETGLTPNIQIGEVKTLEPGSQVKVTRSGSNEEPVFNFELPKGDKGDDYVLTDEDKVEIGEKVNTEYEERIAENENDIVDLESYLDIVTPKATAKGELVHIIDALPLATFENKIDGNVEQETTDGRQLFDGNNPSETNLATTSMNNNILTISSDSTNTVPFAKWNFDVKPNDVIRYSTIIQSVNGQALFQGYNGTWETINETVSIYTDGTTPHVKTYTNTNYTQIRILLYSSRTIPTTNSESIYKNTIVTINNEDMEWEEYSGGIASPNPEYPQEIEVIEGDLSIKVDNGLETTDENYQEQIVYLDLKGNWVGAINDNIKDYLVTDKKKYWLVKNVGKVVLDGSENWQVYTDKIHTFVYWLGTLMINGLCDYFLIIRSDKFDVENGIYVQRSKHVIISFLDISSIEELKTWLSNNNVTVYYQLAEPQIIELGELPELIKTFEGTNNIQLLANLDTEIEVKYALDVKKYFENKLASIQEQIL